MFKKKPIALVYLAGTIDNVSKEESQGWRARAYDMLASIGVVSAVPGLEKIQLTSKQIVELDSTMVNIADAVLVNLSYLTKAPTKWVGTGTLIELGLALSLGRPIIAFTEGKELSHHFKFLNGVITKFCNSLDEAIELIDDINFNSLNGKSITNLLLDKGKEDEK